MEILFTNIDGQRYSLIRDKSGWHIITPTGPVHKRNELFDLLVNIFLFSADQAQLILES